MIRAIHKRLEEREEGFTLIELLVVVIIIGILAAIAIPVFLGQRQRAFRAAVQSDLRNAAVEVETWFTDAQTYVGFDAGAPSAEDGLNTSTGVDIVGSWYQAEAYCVAMSHTNLTETWSIQPGNQLTDSACPAAPGP